MKLVDPCCPRCGLTAGIVITQCLRVDRVSIFCASCRIESIVIPNVDTPRDLRGVV